MRYFFFICSAYLTGVIAAVPAGPVQIEVVRRSVNGHMLSAMMVVLGALVADVLYGIVAFFGIAPFLRDEKVMAYFWLSGALLLIVLSLLVFRSLRRGRTGRKGSRLLRKKRWGFVGGFTLAASNPMMIIWWLLAARLFTDFNIIDHIGKDNAAMLIAAGVSGLASYLIVLSIILHRAKSNISDTGIRRLNIITATVLLVTGGYFFISSIYRLAF
jgi:threonine/homoserine/homoserine lactone efflux protein